MSHDTHPWPGAAPVTRRGVVAGGAAALAALAAAGPASLAAREPPRAGRFADRVVLITGATSGIGRATAEAFAREGARVCFCGRREALGRQVEAGIRRAGGEATYVRADVRDPAQMQGLVDATVRRYGRLDIAHNNAGIGTAPGAGLIHEMTLEHWRAQHATNLDGVLHALRAEVPVMLQQGGGAIVNTVSTMGLSALAGNAAYVSSKHALAGLVKAAALEYAGRGIRVNGVAPGPVDTPFVDAFFSNGQEAEKARLIAALNDKIPLKRRGKPEEIARTVMFLASGEADFLNGHVVVVDGAMGAHEGSAAGEG